MKNSDSGRSKQGLPYFSRSLHWPLMASISGAILLIMLVMGLWIYLFAAQTELSIWKTRQEEALRDGTIMLEDFLQARHAELDAIAHVDPTNFGPDSRALQEFLKQGNSWIELIRLDQSGKILATASRSQPVFINLTNDPLPRWYQESRSGNFYQGDYRIDVDGESYMIISVPGPDGGVVAGRMSMEMLWQIIPKIHYGATGEAYVITQPDGQIIAHKEVGLVESGKNVSGSSFFSSISKTSDNRWFGDYTNLQGVQVIGGSAPIPGTDWLLITEMSYAEGNTIRHSAMSVFTAGLIFLWIWLTIITNRFMNQMVFRPIENLRKGAETVGQGNLQHSIQIIREDEIGAVTAAFNDMTANLAENERRLQFAYDCAMEANRFKSELLSNVSHELRTPLGVIIGYAEMLRDGIVGPNIEDQRPLLQEIITSTSGLTQMVNDLLDQAKLEARIVRLEITAFSPEELLDSVTTRMKIQARTKGLEFETSLTDEMPAVLYGDLVRLEQVLSNLVSNGIKFTQTGKVTVRLYRPGTDHWAMEVCDTGPGIPVEAQKIIFEPFRQVDGSATREQNGTGLGLSIVSQLTDLMHGKIVLDSQPGKGTTFTLLFPILLPPEEETLIDVETDIAQLVLEDQAQKYS